MTFTAVVLQLLFREELGPVFIGTVMLYKHLLVRESTVRDLLPLIVAAKLGFIADLIKGKAKSKKALSIYITLFFSV